MAGAWADFHRRWAALRPPLRPDADVVAAVRETIGGAEARVLLLGATPELAALGERLVAVDWSAEAIAHIWPGNDARQWIVRADWRALPFAAGSFTAVIGDGSLGVVRAADRARVLAEVRRVLRPGGRLALRCYVAPDLPESLEGVRDDALAGRIDGFHAFKWRLAMAVAADADEVAMADVHRAFEALFPDRALLETATGWRVEEIDAYRGSDGWLGFPSAARLLADWPSAELRAAGSYPLAERCPLLVATRA